MTNLEPRLCILTTGGDSGPMYRGQVVHTDSKSAILAHHEPGTKGAEASKYVLIEQQHLKKAAFYNNMDDFNLACHQNNYCWCHEYPDRMGPCLAAGKGPYTGSTFISDDLYSVPYLDLYQDLLDLKPDERLPVHFTYIECVHQALKKNPALIERCIEAILRAGDRHAHWTRLRSEHQEYIGNSFLRFNSVHNVVDHLKVLQYDHDNDSYICVVLTPDQSSNSYKYWVDGRETRFACDGHAQDRFEYVGATISRFSKPDLEPSEDIKSQL